MDNAFLSKIKQTDEIMDKCAMELERNKECESMLDQADCWMGRRNKTLRLMMDWFLAEDGHDKTQEKKCWKHLMVHEEDDKHKEDWSEEPVSSEVSFLLKDLVALSV